MQVGAADRAARDLYDGVAVVLDFRVGDGVAADIRGAVPHQGFHAVLLETRKTATARNNRRRRGWSDWGNVAPRRAVPPVLVEKIGGNHGSSDARAVRERAASAM